MLQETAFICPMLCPKGLRNGPCGSGSSESCCVEPSRPCIWHVIYHRAEQLGRLGRLLEVQAPLDWTLVGGETWGTILSEAQDRNLLSPSHLLRWTGWREEVDSLFRDMRQPDWWQGDDVYHPPVSTSPASSLQARLEHGTFVITAEVSPPTGADPKTVEITASRLRGKIHAANLTQNPMATPRMSSLACSLLLARCGIEPIMQLTARDFNRSALQAEVLGASALGIHNILCLTGDPPTAGDKPAGGLPFDLDATQMLWILRRMRDEYRFLDGREITDPPKLFLGAAGSPSDSNLWHESIRLEKKINAGAQFIQTQLVYDVRVLSQWLEALDRRNLLGKVHILVGIGPIRSSKTARFIQDHIPDVFIPPAFIQKLEKSPEPEETGFEFTLDLMQKMKAVPGIRGIHIMSMSWENVIPRLLREASLDNQLLSET